MFGEGSMYIGYKNYFTFAVDEDKQSSLFIEFLYSTTAATIVSGAVAERCNFFAYIIFTMIISGKLKKISQNSRPKKNISKL